MHIIFQRFLPIYVLHFIYLAICFAATFTAIFPPWLTDYLSLFLIWTFSIQFFQSLVLIFFVFYFLRDSQIKSNKNLNHTYSKIVDVYSLVAMGLTFIGGLIHFYLKQNIYELLTILLSSGVYLELYWRKKEVGFNKQLFREQNQVLYLFFIMAAVILLLGAVMSPILSLLGLNIKLEDPFTLLYFLGLIYFSFKVLLDFRESINKPAVVKDSR